MAIATVADVVPLTGENRIIVAFGLRGLADVRNHGLRALLDAAGVEPGRSPTTSQIGFRVAPRINAAGRMASASEVIELFLTTEPERARDIAARLSAFNAERQAEETRITEEILLECETAATGGMAPALVFAKESWHRGVLGIVASRLVERFCRPVFVLGIDNGEAAGSGRSISAFHLLQSLESMSTLFVKFGGHKQAAGVTIASARIEEFRKSLTEYAGANLRAEDFEPTQRIDAHVRLTQIDNKFWEALRKLEPFGMGNPCPVFAASDVEVIGEPAFMKEKHLRFAAAQDGRVVNFKAFDMAHRAHELTRGRACRSGFSARCGRLLGRMVGQGLRLSSFASLMTRARRLRAVVQWPLLMVLGVITVFFKLVLTRQYTFLESGDSAYQVLPWLQLQVSAIRHGFIVLWDPYEWFGQSLIGQLQPAIASPFTFLLALAPLHDGHITVFYVHVWFVLIHCVAALFAYWLFVDLSCSRAAAAVGGLFYATAAYCGNTQWPQLLAAAIWAPLVFLFLLRTLRGAVASEERRMGWRRAWFFVAQRSSRSVAVAYSRRGGYLLRSHRTARGPPPSVGAFP